jgi:hypothetical protein
MIPIPRVPVSQQSYGQFAAPTAAPMQDAGPQQMQQLGASLLNAGASAARIGADLQADLDQGFLMESDALASELARNTVGSYRQMAGLPAIESFGDTQEQLRTKLRNLSDTARSPEQKQRLERILVQRMQDASESMAAHRDVQVRNRAIGGAKAGMESEIQNYLAALGNPDDMKLARDLMIERAGELSRHRGEDGDMAKLTLLDATTRMHAGAVDALLAADRPTEALAYLEQHQGEIAPQERAQVARVVQRATVADKAQRLVGDFEGRGMSYADQIETADALFQNGTLTVEERDETVQRATQADSMRRRAAAAEAADVLTAGEQLLAGSMDAKLSDNPQLYARAERAGVLPQLLQFERSRKAATDPMALAEALSLPEESLAQVSRAQIVQRYWGRLTPSDLEAVLSRRDRAAGDGSRSQGPSVMGLDDRVVSSYLKLKGLDDNGKVPPSNAVEFQAFRKNVQEQIDAERAEGGKVTPERIRQIMEQAKIDTVYLSQPWIFSDGSPTPRMLLTDEQEARAGVISDGEWIPLGAIPSDVLSEITRKLNAAGQRVNDQALADAWKSMGKPKTVAAMPKPPSR